MQFTDPVFNGGHHQFVDGTLINQYPNSKVEQNDIELLKFISEAKIEEKIKQAVKKDVVIVNDDTVSTEVREDSHNRISQFLLNHKDEISAWTGRISKIVITAILAKYGLSLENIGLE
jgi:hypothetical protein